MQHYAVSDRGCRRERNEDAFWVSDRIRCFVVADGMGGHAGGQRASRLAVSIIEKVVHDHLDEVELEQYPQLLGDSIRTASKQIYRESQDKTELRGMGTTVTALLLKNGRATIAHVGDSRAYLIRSGEIQQLTEDHSLVQEQCRAGFLTPDQAKSSRYRNIITRSVGFEDDVDVDMTSLDALEGDVFLLCTDGLNTLVEDEEILQALQTVEPHNASQHLVDLANSRGGHDNTTIVLVYV
ncbi:MAG: Stp1/IreP family PP2C-type Ser/Thr phosphatase [Myxococcaceae bacterium]|nr:Stp1/IreP family PP2C-type Ser/Thr phosphatase [Myxococcaceae bacterium]MBH2006588.1 Stp1/IreP family PP2C-type Ser/Thr phosphatase [Myxococcaceae bacterium]